MDRGEDRSAGKRAPPETMKKPKAGPDRGALCEHCGTRIPEFNELDSSEEEHVRWLISDGKRYEAIQELVAFTGCPRSWAEVWVEHEGKPLA